LSGDGILYYFVGNVNSKDKRIYFVTKQILETVKEYKAHILFKGRARIQK